MNWQRWIRPGLVLTLLVAVVSVVTEKAAIEADLSARVTDRLVSEGQGWASVSASARGVALTGLAPSTDSQEQATRIAAAVAGVARVENASELLPIASPYIWSARRAGPEVVLTGNVPSEGVRAAVLATARRALPDGAIRDEMTLARGAPASFGPATTFSLSNLANLIEGTVTLTDATLAVSGTAVDARSYVGAREAFTESLPPNVSLGPVDVLPARADPFVWSANYDGKRIELYGYVPNDIVHDTLLATIRATLPGVEVADSVAVASGEPSGFAEAASFAVASLERLKQGGVTLDGLRLDVTGDARSVEDYDALLNSLEGPLPNGMTVVASAVMPASVSPYGWRGERTGDAVVLEGYVPNATSLQELADSARALFPGAKIDDRVRVATGEPQMDWVGGVKFAMGELAKLRTGSVSLSDNTYSIEGEAATPDSYIAIRDANARTLPASLELSAGDVTPPRASPFVFIAERRGNGIAVAGNVPDPDVEQRIMEDAGGRFGESVGKSLVYASGAPEGFVEAVDLALRILGRVAGGRVEIRDTSMSVAGVVYNAAAVDDLGEDVRDGVPEGFTLTSSVLSERQAGQPVLAQRCSELLQRDLRVGRIEFDGNRADISADSYGVLDRISATLDRCADTAVEVGAHSDSEGSTSRNRDRTQARAEAIVDYLSDAGVKRERLKPVGYGEDNPIADNKTAAGKAANRRIEFSVAVPEGG